MLLAAAWAVSVGGGLLLLWSYGAAPGAAGAAPARWPAASRVAAGSGSQSTLVVALHPRCPCSRATVRELDRIMARSGGMLRAHVLFVRPDGVPAGWERAGLWRDAAAIPGVSVAADAGGHEARRFGAETSGQVVLYDPQGRLVFRGGITPARGHEGDNAGAEAITAVVRGSGPPDWGSDSARTGAVQTTPVYGCELGVTTTTTKAATDPRHSKGYDR